MASDEVLIVAGEVSGDLHAAPVVEEMKRMNPDLWFFGAGGSRMERAGVELFSRVEDLAIMGFSGIPKTLPLLKRLKNRIVDHVRANNTRLAILVDYPGFNLNLAASLKKLPNPPQILEYIAPQVWAWRPNRVEKIRKVIDKLAVVLPFEEKLFRNANIPTEFVGHPLLDELAADSTLFEIPDNTVAPQRHFFLNPDLYPPVEKPLLGLLPGSRVSVVHQHLQIMVRASQILKQQVPDLQIGIGCAPGLDKDIFKAAIRRAEGITLWDNSRSLLKNASAAIVCSGTATLEAALIGTPQVVIYKTSSLNYEIIRRMIQLPFVSLVNIVAEEKIVPEVLQHDMTPQSIFHAVSPLLKNCPIRNNMLSSYLKVRKLLGEGGAAGRVARIALQMMN